MQAIPPMHQGFWEGSTWPQERYKFMHQQTVFWPNSGHLSYAGLGTLGSGCWVPGLISWFCSKGLESLKAQAWGV